MTNANEAIRNIDRETATSTSGFVGGTPSAAAATNLLAAKEAEQRKLTQAVVKIPPLDPMLRETYDRLVADGARVLDRTKSVEQELGVAMEEFANLSNRIAVLNQQRAKLQQQAIALTMSKAQMKANFDLNVTDI